MLKIYFAQSGKQRKFNDTVGHLIQFKVYYLN